MIAIQMCTTLIPLIRKNGRIVNISSVASGLTQYSDDIRQRFRSPKMKLQDLEDMMNEYQVR